MASPLIQMPEGTAQFFSLPPSDYINAYLLQPGVPAVVAPPEGVSAVMFSATGNFWVWWGSGQAALPSGSIIDGTAPDLNPTVRQLKGRGARPFSIIAAASTTVTVQFYR
jgi:hypothetical protein